ncbi:MAG: hypothetical protein NZZ60_03975 [Bacteroidia bacterium]|nr:hypothetical protein [Bacteroidia bacterium]MDW8416867.1 hypothetical protein [Bacteroidia bacterium]
MQALREIEERLTSWVSAQLAEAFPDVFLVEARMRVHGPEPEVYLRVDTDRGITLDQCVKIHLYLKERLHSVDWLPEHVGISVSSPGVGTPLRLRRQYLQNIGRLLKVKTKNGTIRGILTSVDDTAIQLRHYRRVHTISWDDIHTARVEIPRARQAIRSKSR